MTSIERTAYPRFGRVVTARELDVLSPLQDEIEWARDRSRSDGHLLGLVVGANPGEPPCRLSPRAAR